ISLLQGRFISLYFTYQNGSVPVKLCDYPHIENGRLTGYYKNHREKDFPVRLGVTIFYRCLDGYVSKSESTWNLIRCTADGWDPMPKCLKKCSPGHLENGRFLSSYSKTYKEGDEISYECADEHSPKNLQYKVTRTKNDWSPTPRCILKNMQDLCNINGYFYASKNRFNLNEEATYRCQTGYTTPEGNEMGEDTMPQRWMAPFLFGVHIWEHLQD
uniref:Sushi domain-containing protein n=1 Tax=Terrapene triunguis TaxID=2587831 RepID=A0A674JN54_9SAUR